MLLCVTVGRCAHVLRCVPGCADWARDPRLLRSLLPPFHRQSRGGCCLQTPTTEQPCWPPASTWYASCRQQWSGPAAAAGRRQEGRRSGRGRKAGMHDCRMVCPSLSCDPAASCMCCKLDRGSCTLIRPEPAGRAAFTAPLSAQRIGLLYSVFASSTRVRGPREHSGGRRLAEGFGAGQWGS